MTARQSLERGRDRDGLGGAGRSGGGANQVLTITAGQTSSTGAVTITAKNNGVDASDSDGNRFERARHGDGLGASAPHLLGRLVARDADAMIKQARPASQYIVVRLRIPWLCKRRAGSGPKRDEPVQPRAAATSAAARSWGCLFHGRCAAAARWPH